MKKKLLLLALLVLVLVGAALTLYPLFGTWYLGRHQTQVRTEYQNIVAQADDAQLQAVRQAAEEYNERLRTGTGTQADELEYEQLLNLAGNGVMGYIEIPKIDVMLPIGHGVSDSTLSAGAGHLPNTSLPIGGSGTHAVISAHTGMSTSKMFTDLGQLELGDRFYVHVLGDVLCYEVDQVLTVLPEEVDALAIVPEQDYVTLVTCTPYGVNTHRLLLRGHRANVPDAQAEEAAEQEQPHAKSTWTAKYLQGILVGLLIFAGIAAITAIIFWLRRRRRTGT